MGNLLMILSNPVVRLSVQIYLIFGAPTTNYLLQPGVLEIVPFLEQTFLLQQVFVTGIRPAMVENLLNTAILVREVFFNEFEN